MNIRQVEETVSWLLHQFINCSLSGNRREALQNSVPTPVYSCWPFLLASSELACVTVLLWSISGQKPSFLLMDSGHCEIWFCVFRQSVPNRFTLHALKMLFWCLLSCVLSVFDSFCLSCSYALAYAKLWEQQRFSAFKIKLCLYVFAGAKKKKSLKLLVVQYFLLQKHCSKWYR